MGWYAAAFALLRFGQFLGGFGLHTVIVRSDDVEMQLRRQILGIALTVSFIVTAVYIAALLLLQEATFGGEPKRLLSIMLPVTLLNCYSMTANALMVRELRFRGVFAIRVSATLAYQVVAIPLAISGMGAMSLAIALVASTLVFSTFSTFATKGAFLIWPRLKGARHVTRFASIVFLTNGVQQASDAVIMLLVGKIAGFSTLGLFSRGNDLVQQANRVVGETVMPVLVPHIFRAARQKEPLRPIYLTGLQQLSVVSWPTAAVLALIADPLVLVLLGKQWGQVGELLQVLALSVAIFPVAALSRTFGVALHMETKLLWQTIIGFISAVLLTILLTSFGLKMLALGLVAVQFLLAILAIGLLKTPLSFSNKSLCVALLPSAGVTLICASSVVAFGVLLPAASTHFLIVLMGSITVSAIGWLVGVYGLNHPIKGEITTIINFVAIQFKRTR